jgi:hypothetical protein
MRTIKLALLALILSSVAMFAQGQQEQTKLPDLDITFLAGDFAIVYQNLASVDIKGEEAQAFLDVQTFLKPYIDNMVANKTKTDDPLKIKVGAQMANSLFVFSNRITIKGGEAQNIIRFRKAIVDAAQATKAAK